MISTVSSIWTRHLDQEALDWCFDLAMRRSGSMQHRDTPNSKNMNPERPGWHRHFIGVIGELAYSWFSDHPVNQDTIGEGDDGTDFPDGVQIKSSDLDHEPNLLFLTKQWERKLARTYVLAWVQNVTQYRNGAPCALRCDGAAFAPRVTLMGWSTREEIESKAVKKDLGRETMVFAREYLHPMGELR